MIEGYVRRDEHGRTFLVEVINRNLKETFLFTCKDGNFSLDDTIPVGEAQKPKQAESSAEPVPIEDPAGLGHEILDELVSEYSAESERNLEPAPF
jgi:hypothetical protein